MFIKVYTTRTVGNMKKINSKMQEQALRSALFTATFVVGIAGAALLLAPHYRAWARQAVQDTPLVTGKAITPLGTQTQVGSLPMTVILSPDGKTVLVSSIGERAFISALSAADGHLVSQIGFGQEISAASSKTERDGLYFGLAFGKPDVNGVTPVYASRGADHLVSVLALSLEGVLTDTRQTLHAENSVVAGLAASSDGRTLYVANNDGDPKNGMTSVVHVLTLRDGKTVAKIPVPGYPYAVAAITRGVLADKKVYVSSEQRGVCVINLADYPDLALAALGTLPADLKTDTKTEQKTRKLITTGEHPQALLLNGAQDRLFVANTGSDTVSIVHTDSDRIEKTILLRPAQARGLPGATPTGLALAPDEKTLYVTLADMNAVAVVDLTQGAVIGYIPVGWYPTAVTISPDGKRLFVANAKGVITRIPNDKPVPVAATGKSPKYIQSILEGTLSTIDLGVATRDLAALTAQTLANNRIVPGLAERARATLQNPGIQHVIYILKENRTYDQVLGDLSQGNGDASLVMFGRAVTPNQHALAERFALLDNFYCAAEVSGDGWNWSTSGMGNPFIERNVPYGYTGREHPYDYEGTNNGVAVDLLGIPDVGRPPGGHLWDAAAKRHVSLRNYGFYCDDLKQPRTTPEQGPAGQENTPTKKALMGITDRDFRAFDLTYADSDAWVKWGLSPAPLQHPRYGKHDAPSRFSEWKREFDQYVKSRHLPQCQLVRLGNDHTTGTTAGNYTPQAMVADNDYAVGQLVEAVSHSPFWKSTAIFVLEDDAQNGNDHVDAHRSIAFVISPYITRATYDSHFYNTDSMLHTIENILGLGPMCQYDAVAPTLNLFGAQTTNAAPYTALLPDKAIIAQTNTATAYRARDSRRLFSVLQADTGHEDAMNDIVWHAVKGKNVPRPPSRRAFTGTGVPIGDGDD